MRVEELYPTPVMGVSTQAARNRVKGQAGVQNNFRSDPVHKLTRRPSLEYILRLIESIDADDVVHHSYELDGETYRIIIDTSTGDVYGFKDNVELTVEGDLSEYVGDNLRLQTVDDVTYVVNTDTTIVKSESVDTAYFKYVHINVTSALSYGETVEVNVTDTEGTVTTVSYTVPELGTDLDYDTADTARATNQVAIELAELINESTELAATAKGSSVAIYTLSELTSTITPNYTVMMCAGLNPTTCTIPEQAFSVTYYNNSGETQTDSFTISATSGEGYGNTSASEAAVEALEVKITSMVKYYNTFDNVLAAWEGSAADPVYIYGCNGDVDTWPYVEIETGQGDRSCVAFNEITQETTGIPLYAKVGTRITVRPDPTDDDDVYYLQAERVASEASGDELEEVVWAESRKHDAQYTYDLTTMPYTINYSSGTDKITVAQGAWTEREVGDDDSNEWPEFVDNTITDIGYFQKRLVFLSGNYACMSETDDEDNFFRQSAVQLVTTDRTEVSSSATAVDHLQHIIPHNRDMLLFAPNGQFKIDGTEGITPTTVSMSMTTRYECQTDVAPKAIGNAVMFAIDYGDSTGIMSYTAEANTNQDVAHPLTHHIIGYMPGSPKLLAASPNLEMLALVTDQADQNQIFVYEQYTTRSGEIKQQAWSTWTLSGDATIIDIEFRNNKLTVIAHEGTSLYIKELNLYTRVSTNVDDIFLDDLVALDTDGTTTTLPDGYVVADDMICIRGSDLDYSKFKAPFTESDGTLTFSEDIGTGTVYVGKPFTSTFQPTRPFKYTDDGVAITTDRIRVGRFIVGLVDTYQLKMDIISDYYDSDTQEFTGRIMNSINGILGELPLYTGDYKFSYGQDASLADASFYCDHWLGCTIASLSWEGQYYQSKGRM